MVPPQWSTITSQTVTPSISEKPSEPNLTSDEITLSEAALPLSGVAFKLATTPNVSPMSTVLRASPLPPFNYTSRALCGTSFMAFGSNKMPSFAINMSVRQYSICISAVSIHAIVFMYAMLTKIYFKLTISMKLSSFHSTSRTNVSVIFTLPSNPDARPLIASTPSPQKSSLLTSDQHPGVT